MGVSVLGAATCATATCTGIVAGTTCSYFAKERELVTDIEAMKK